MLKISSKLHTDENNDMNATKENKAILYHIISYYLIQTTLYSVPSVG